MKVSVVIPAYNEERFIGLCLESLLNQEEAADEIIVVDNNSKDHTAKIAKKYGVRVVSEKKQGMIPARNAGYNSAQFDIIARSDADNVLPPYWIKRIKESFLNEKIDALAGPVKYSDLAFNTLWACELYTKAVKLVVGSEVLVGPNHALTRSMWQKVKHSVCLDDKLVHEDIDLTMNILKLGGTIHKNRNLVINSSGRRLKNVLPYLTDYPVRLVKTLALYNYGR